MLTLHHDMQAHIQQSYADNSAEALLGVLHQLDAERLHAALHQAMAVQSGGHTSINLVYQSTQLPNFLLWLVTAGDN